MSKKLSQTERIKRHLLRKGIDYPATKVVEELKGTGCLTTLGLVYNTRSVMKQGASNGEPVKPLNGHTPKTITNSKTLGESIISVLEDGSSLTVNEITDRVKSSGFKTKSQNFSHSVRMECYRLVADKRIKDNPNGDLKKYSLVEVPVVVTPTPVVVETTLGLDTASLTDLISVQKLVAQFGGIDRLKQHLNLFEELVKKPATDLLESFARKTSVGV